MTAVKIGPRAGARTRRAVNDPALIAETDIAMPCPRWDAALDDAAGLCRRAALAALGAPGLRETAGVSGRPVELGIVLTDDREIADLNRQFRRREGATNVLSFPARDDARHPAGPDAPPVLLGDVVLAFETIAAEAEEQSKALADHLAHLVIHGILHLLGQDHANQAEADRMERLEIELLGALGIADPYVEERPFVA
jgi:probable rRNA maturation factor